jgi:hypothetical protein
MLASRRALFVSCSLLVGVLGAVDRASSQGLVAVVNPATDRQLLAVHPATGTAHLLGQPLGGEPVGTGQGTTTLDRAGNRLFFVGTPSGDPAALFVVSTISGLQLARPTLSNTQNGVFFIDWDEGESILFCLVGVGIGDRQLGTVNTTTGAVTLRGSPIQGGTVGTGGVHALDAAGNRFFFVGTPSGGSSSIFSIDTATGAKLASPVLTGTATNLVGMAWDDNDDELVALVSVNAGDRQLATVNTATGAVTLIGNPIGGEAISTSSGGALDDVADRYYFVGDPASAEPTVYTLSTVTGFELESHVVTGTTLGFLDLTFDPGPLFADGFASGNTSAWSDVQP